MSSAAPGAPSTSRALFKDIARGSGVYFIGFIVQRLAGILMMPITTRFLSPADYGICRSAGTIHQRDFHAARTAVCRRPSDTFISAPITRKPGARW